MKKIKYLHIIFSLISAVICFYFWGIIGLFIGTLLGYIAFFIITYIIQIVNGGVIPRKERKKVARNYLNNFNEIANKLYPNIKYSRLLRYIEKIIEIIFKQSIIIEPSEEKLFDKTILGQAIMELESKNESPEIKRLYKTIYLQIINDLYPDATPNMVFPEIDFANEIENISIPFKWLYYIPPNLKPTIYQIDLLEELRIANSIANDKFGSFVLQSNAFTRKVQINHYNQIKEESTLLSEKEILKEILETRVFGIGSWGWTKERTENALKDIDSIESLIKLIIRVENEIDLYNKNPILKRIDNIIYEDKFMKNISANNTSTIEV